MSGETEKPPEAALESEAYDMARSNTREERPSKSGVVITLANLRGLNDKWVCMLKKADANGDGCVDAAEVVQVVEAMLREQSMHRMYRFMTVGLFVVTMVLIGALSGITYSIVEITKDTKVSTYSNSTYQFLLTKSGLAAVTGSAALDLSGISNRTEGPSRRSMLAGGAAGSSGQRRVLSDYFNQDDWGYVGTVPYMTVEMGCSLLSQNIVQFPISISSSSFFVNGSTIQVVKVLQHTGCDDGDVNKVSAYVKSESGLGYWVYCDASIEGCDVWAYLPDIVGSETNSTGTTGLTNEGRRRLQQSNPKIRPVPGANYMANPDDPEVPSDDQKVLCFPADATVDVYSKGAVRMSELQYGDLVRSYNRFTGAVHHRAVYVFGHRQKRGASTYSYITAADRTLAISRGHFVPVCVARCTAAELSAGSAVMENRRAGDVRVGDVLVTANPSPEPAPVTHVDRFIAQGAYAPFVRGADLIVDGVVASPHAVWVLDSVAPAWMVPYLPYIYEVMLAPVYGLYCIVGPVAAEWLAGTGLIELAKSGLHGYAASMAILAAPVVAASLLGRAASRRLVRF